MHSEFKAGQFDEVFQFITETSSFDQVGFSTFMDDLDRYHPTFQQWAFKTVLQVQAYEKMYLYMQSAKRTPAVSYDFQRFLQFVFETYGFDQEGIEAFKKSLGQVKPYQDWLAAKTDKKAATKRQTRKMPGNTGHLRLVK
jgi:hypothetical protein